MVRYAGESISDIEHDVTSGGGVDCLQGPGGVPNLLSGQTGFCLARRRGDAEVLNDAQFRVSLRLGVSANGDFLEFFLNGVRQDRIRGEGGSHL
jgi:hypothetical protein